MVAREDFDAELLDILRALIKIDTSNPPGNETAAAEFVKGIMEREAVAAKVFESKPGRGSVVARLKGNGAKAPLLLLSHLDVVPVEAQRWSVDAFAGEIKDGYIWGRGALDIKNLASMEIMALLLAKRTGLRLKRDVILAATADEEAGGTYGIRWLIQNHFDEIKAEYAINEGGLGLVLDGRKAVLCQCAEKGICWVRITVRGEGGHGSLPSGGNPVVLAGEIISRIGQHVFPAVKTSVTERLLAGAERLGLLPGGLRAADLFTAERSVPPIASRIDKRLNALVRNTATPTLVRGGTKVNVIPMETQVSVDCRVLPGFEPQEMFEIIKDLVELPNVQYEILQKKPGSESRTDTELWSVLESCVKEIEPDAAFLPYLSPGGTDSGFLREKGVICYGFDPAFVTLEELDTVHGVDERISVENMIRGTVLLFKAIEKLCT